MQRPRHEFLPGARLAGHQHVDGAGGHAFDDGIDRRHRRTLAQKALERIGPLDRAAEHLLRVAPPRLGEDPHERVLEVGLGPRDVEVVAGAGLQAEAGGLDVGRRVEHHGGQIGIGLPNPVEELSGRSGGPGRHDAEIPGIGCERGEPGLE